MKSCNHLTHIIISVLPFMYKVYLIGLLFASWLKLLLCNDDNAHEGAFGLGPVTEEDIYRMCQLCGDSSAPVRTTAAGAIYSLIERQHFKGSCDIDILNMLEIAWTDFVLPLVLDFESTCVTKAVNMFFSLVIGPILEVAGTSDSPLFEATTFKRKYLSYHLSRFFLE